MKKNNLLYIYYLIISLSGLGACKKYLDERPANNLATPETLTDLQALLDNALKMNIGLTPSYSEASADDYFLLQDIYEQLGTNEQNSYSWRPFQYSYGPDDWSKCYEPVYVSNLCLERLETIPRTVQNSLAWDNVKGSALFFRSFNFLQLVWQHAKAYDEDSANTDIGIPVRVNSDFNIASVRGTVKDSYERIISDAKDAASILVDNSVHVIRPSKAAAYGLLARTYLSMRSYDSALKYSDLCLSIKPALLDYNSSEINFASSVPFFQQYNNPEIIFYTEMNSFISAQDISYALIDTILYSSYDVNDWRRAGFFRPNGSFKRFKGTYTGSNGVFFTGIATDEMYLTRAECYARKNNTVAALIDLNELLLKRWKAGMFTEVTAIDASDALNKILLERRKELLMRGLRWIDIKRLNKEGRNIVLKRVIANQEISLQPNSNLYALPLPTDIIDLTGMQQNP